MKNVLILSSSPRRGGNSDTLCDEFMQGAIESGHRVEKVFCETRPFTPARDAACAANTRSFVHKKMTRQRLSERCLPPM